MWQQKHENEAGYYMKYILETCITLGLILCRFYSVVNTGSKNGSTK